MTDCRYGFVGQIDRPVEHGFSSMDVSVYAKSGDFFGFLVRDLQTGELILPTRQDVSPQLIAKNGTPMMAAFMARWGKENEGEWLPDRRGNMQEAWPNTIVMFDNTGYNDVNVHRIEVSYRFPEEPNVLPGMPAGSTPKGDSGTGLHYRPRTYSFGVIRFMERDLVARLLADDGAGEFNPADDYSWSPGFLIRKGLRSRLIDLSLEPVSE